MSARPYHHGNLRAAVLDAAATLLERDGPVALSLRAVARAAGVSHAAPVHHFGDLAGLLGALAATGFVRFHEWLRQAEGADTPDPLARSAAYGVAYVEFARAHPNMFQLMFRSSRLDWSRPELVEAAQAAFALLVPEDADRPPADPDGLAPERMALALSRWCLAHGAAMLALDGRIEGFAARQGISTEAMIAAALQQGIGRR